MKQFETDAFKMVIHDDLLKEVTVKKDIVYTEKDVWESRDLSVNYKPGAKFYVLFEGQETSRVTVSGKSAAASAEYYESVAALALYSENMLQSIRGNLFLKVNRPKVPTRFFDDRADAIEWLREQMEGGK